jgi:hypothetical protein
MLTKRGNGEQGTGNREQGTGKENCINYCCDDFADSLCKMGVSAFLFNV